MLPFNTSVFFKYHTCSLMMTGGLFKIGINEKMKFPTGLFPRDHKTMRRTCGSERKLPQAPCCVRILNDPILTKGFHPFTHLSIRPFMPASRPPASLHHVRRWVIGSGSSHYGVPVECSSSSPLMRRLLFSPSHRTDRFESSSPPPTPREHLTQLGWRGGGGGGRPWLQKHEMINCEQT